MSAMTTLPQPPALDAMASGKPVALFLDFEWTLVEIAPTPDGIDVPPGLLPAEPCPPHKCL